MILSLPLPTINPHMKDARIELLYAATGELLKSGSKLLDLGIDLSRAFAQECPPVSFFRIVLRETVTLRQLNVERGDLRLLGEELALFSTDPDEPLGPPARTVRMAAASIIYHEGLWTGSAA